MEPADIKLESERLILRPVQPGDEPQIIEYANYEENWKWTLVDLYPYYPEHARDFVARSVRGLQTGDHFVLGIHLKEVGHLIGAVDLRIIEKAEGCAEIGYMISYPYWGNGYAPEAVKLSIGFAFDKLKLHRIQAGIFDANPRSGRVLEKCGFKKEGTERERYNRDGKWHDAICYAILENEFKGIQYRL
jgi:RimJ/RimL family protein N-acetyltransferase